MNPWVLLGIVLAAGLMTGGAYWQGRQDGAAGELASQAREEAVARVAREAAATAAAEAISKIEVKHVTLRQELEREIRTNTVFRECRSGNPAVRMLNDSPAIERPEPAGDRKLPAAAGAGG